MQIFISHSSQNAETATGICEKLEEDGHSCFIAPRDIRPGRDYAEEIINGIRGADALLLLLTEQSNQSPHVLREVERAGSGRLPIVVYKLEEVVLTKSLEYFLMTNQWIDGTKDTDYRKVSEAFAVSPGQADVRLPKRGLRKLDRRGIGKRMIPILVLFLAICVIVFAAGRLRYAGIRETDVEHPVTDSRAQSADDGIPGAEDGFPGTGNGTQDVVGGSLETDGPADAVDLDLGASVELGTYGGEPIVWRVLHILKDGEQLILVSDQILTMKAFDAPESGKYNSDGSNDYWAAEIEDKLLESRVRGSNMWCDSNIRTWLNSEKENVVYEDQAPTASAMSEKKNGYSNESGFLHGFTEEERAVLRQMQVLTVGNVLMDSWGTETQDRVFLLSQQELEWFGEADISIYASPTDYAVEQDRTGWYCPLGCRNIPGF